MRPPTRRWLAAATAAVAASVVVAACSSSPSSGSSSSGGKNFGAGATGVVHFWARAATAREAELMVKDFNATHKNLKVVITETAGGEAVTKLATAIRAGSPPDLIGLNDINMPIFTHENAFMNLTKYVGALPYKNALSPGHLRLATYQGQYYGVPYLADLSGLWYNKVLFKRAGIASPPTDFAEILSDAKKVEALGGGVSGFSFAGDCEGCLAFTMLPDVWATGTHLINGNIPHQTANITGNAPLKALLELYRQIWADKLVPASDRTQTGTTWGKNFLAGKVGIEPGGYGVIRPGLTAANRSEFGFVPLPGPTGGYSTFDGGDDFAIPNGAKNPSGAWEFVKFVLSKSEQLKYPEAGFTPVRTDILNAAYTQAHPFDSVVLKALTRGYAPTTLAYNSTFNQVSGPWFAMFSEAVYKGNISGALSSGQSGFSQQLSSSGSGS
jgi:multiple sugar transport system substrate-binding protein